MIPFLTYPFALLALATLPALAAIYLLRNRFRRRPVSSVLLWKFPVQSKQGGSKVHRLQLPLLFFLELLILTLLVTAAAAPHWKLPQATRPLIVILDDSFSLHAAGGDGRTSQARAQDYLAGLFRLQAPPTTRLILAGREPRALGGSLKTWTEVSAALAGWRCQSPAAALDRAITLAAELGHQQANILVLTDRKPADAAVSNPRLEWHAFGEPLDNFAIVNAARTALGDQDRCLLEIANFSGTPRTARLLVQTGGNSNALQSSTLDLGAHETRRLVFNLPAATPELHARLDPDALPDDNEVQLLPPIRPRVRVRVDLPDAGPAALANRTLDATGLRAALTDNPQLVIRATEPPGNSVSSNLWTLCWAGAEATNAYTGPFIVDSSHPLATGFGLNGVIWSAAGLTNRPGDLPVVLAGNVPLVSVRTDLAGARHVRLNFNPDRSTVQNTPAWPVLYWNLLQWRIAEMPGLKESNTRLGATVTLKTAGGAVTVTQPDNTVVNFPKTGGELALETPLPGIYRVTMDATTNRFAVNVLAAEKSDLAAATTGAWGRWSDDLERRLEDASLTGLLGLLALGLLAAHLYLVTAAKGAS